MRDTLPGLAMFVVGLALALGGCWLSDAEIQERLDAEDTAAAEADTGLP